MVAQSLAFGLAGPGALWKGYCTSLERRPLLTKCATSMVGFALGDLLCQASSRQAYAPSRTLRMAAYGGLLAGPMGATWFNVLEKGVFPKAPTSPLAIASKIGIDQAFMAPFGTALFFAVTNLMDGQPQAVLPAIKEKLVPTVTASWKLWPVAHLVNFALIPPHQRILYTNIISVGWTYVLSQMSQVGVKTETAGASPPQQVARHCPTDELTVVVEEIELVGGGAGELVPITVEVPVPAH